MARQADRHSTALSSRRGTPSRFASSLRRVSSCKDWSHRQRKCLPYEPLRDEILATASLDNTVKLWNSQGILLRTLTAHTGGVRRVAFSPDGTQLASASIDQTAILWDLKRILNTDPLAYGCDRVRHYLRTNADVKEEDRHLCDRIQ